MEQMIPYFFAAGHVNYARYGLYYLRSMHRLPDEVLKKFLKGDHVMRHNLGLWNGLWSDMFIETTFMRYGKGPGGIVGVTPSTVKRWALSLHITSRIESDLEGMRLEQGKKQALVHKEEMPGRISSDSQDRDNIRQKLEMCIDPLSSDDHPMELSTLLLGEFHQSLSMSMSHCLWAKYRCSILRQAGRIVSMNLFQARSSPCQSARNRSNLGQKIAMILTSFTPE